jgi:photosystem II stability/assembly factor-like uncharacterized protein
VALAAALLGSSSSATEARAAGRPLACVTIDGPCAFIDSQDVLLPAGGGAPLFATNFGLLTPTTTSSSGASPGWEFVCDDKLGGPMVALRVRAGARGRLLAAGREGLAVTGDLCGVGKAGGSVGAVYVSDVAVDPRDSQRVWAVTRDRGVHLSTNGGDTFALVTALPTTFRPGRLLVAPSDPKRVYVAGAADDAALVLATSRDGGVEWDVDTSGAGFVNPLFPVDLLGVHPRHPDTLFLHRPTNDGGDEVHRSVDGGRTWARVLKLEGLEAFQGLAFDERGDTVFVVGRENFVASADAPAHLYVSRDRGTTWPTRVPSGRAGPFYRCIAHRDGVLYACGAGPNENDRFLFGASDDEGITWRSLVDPAQIDGAKVCVADTCAATAAWLSAWQCERLGRCASGPGAGDAGAPDARRPEAGRLDAGADGGEPQTLGPKDRGGCALGRSPQGSNPGAIAPISLLVVVSSVRAGLARRRAGRRRRGA